MEEFLAYVLLFLSNFIWPLIGVAVGVIVGRRRGQGTGGVLAPAAVGLVLGLACSALWYFLVLPAIVKPF